MLIDIYVHAGREHARAACEKAGLTGDALHYGSFLGYEHKLTFDVEFATGRASLVRVDDRDLAPEKKYHKE